MEEKLKELSQYFNDANIDGMYSLDQASALFNAINTIGNFLVQTEAAYKKRSEGNIQENTTTEDTQE